MESCLEEVRRHENKHFETVYIGGGTPSAVGATLLGIFLAGLEKLSVSAKEMTVEVNPESVTEELCDMLADSAVSRISMGVQSMDDAVLRLLGRAHDRARALAACDLLRRKLPDRDLNLDYIYDIPGISADTIRKGATELIALSPQHVSAYAYSNDTGYLSEDKKEDPFQTLLLAELLQKAGYERYEISNYACGGKKSQHNSRYWQMLPYIGIGAGAHSMTEKNGRRRRMWHGEDISAYIANPFKYSCVEEYTAEQMIKEDIVFGLRLGSGINLLDIRQKYTNIPVLIEKKIEELIAEGLLEGGAERIWATEKGWLLLDSVMSYLW